MGKARVCAVFGCRPSKDSNLRYHKFPSNVNLASQWIYKCFRSDHINIKYAVVCERHFSSAQIERNLKYELLNLPVPRTVRNLKQDAIPDQNLPSRGHRCQGIGPPPAFKDLNMPRTFVPKGERQTGRTTFKEAFQYHVETGCSIREASKKFGMKVILQDAVSRSRKLSDGKTFVPLHGSPHKVFTKEQETQLCDYAIKIAKKTQLPAKKLRKLAYQYALACKSPCIPSAWEREQCATRDWYYAFMTRHPQLTLKALEGMPIARAVSFNKHSVGMFFDAYIEAMEKYRISPDRIFNLDESSLSTVMEPLKVACEKGKPVASQISHERGKSMTFVGIISAGGSFLPPVFIIPRNRWDDSFMKGTLAGSKGVLNHNGWMNGECFFQTLEHIQEKTFCSPENKILLIMDDAECHMNIKAIEYAMNNGIVIVTLPSHTTDKLQPLDVAVFGPFKLHMRGLLNDYSLVHPQTHITEHMLPGFASKAWIRACTPLNVISGFSATGIWPVNRNIFPDEVYRRAAVTDQPEPPLDNDREDHTAVASPTSHHPSNATEEPVISVSIVSSSTVFDCPPPLPSRDSSITTAAIPSTSSAGLSPQDIRPYPKVAARPRGKERKKVHACILTKNEAIENLREKSKKKSVAKKKKSCKTTKKKPQEPSSSEDEDNPEVVLDDSSEYSDEVDGEAEDQPYPFVQEAEIGDFIFVECW
ncbi:uncharacterized protein LOC123504448 [Portunus trituberculatus]|uniref:uncharacterized protein LOC123504448 n=1 Tax=Portunus trituberculatus TaxID=210409 RepID=UPI001E1CD299|nr:uncharacterized protein LOC123504448 [Portunus trituberculatus]